MSINTTVFHRLGASPIEEMTMDKFWVVVTPKSRLYVRTETEMEYFQGMQLIEGKPFGVFYGSEELDHLYADHKAARWRNRFYTNDPLGRA